jgi:hypothetical protein
MVFAVSRKIPLTKSRVQELASFRRSVRDAILERRVEAFHYVTLEDAG